MWLPNQGHDGGGVGRADAPDCVDDREPRADPASFARARVQRQDCSGEPVQTGTVEDGCHRAIFYPAISRIQDVLASVSQTWNVFAGSISGRCQRRVRVAVTSVWRFIDIYGAAPNKRL